MVRRTVSLPESTDALVRELAEEGESFSAAVTRLIEAGASANRGGNRLGYIGSGEGPGDEIASRADEIVREIIAEHVEKENPSY
jgi:hypothetical protein